MKIVESWKDSLGGCPSQCTMKFEFMGRRFFIYLRWRWQDPWKAYLCECGPEWDIHDSGYNWITIPIENFTEDQLEELKDSVINEVKIILKTL